MEMQRLPIDGTWLISPHTERDTENAHLYREGHELTKFTAHGLSGTFVHDEIWEAHAKGVLDGVYHWRLQPPAMLMSAFRGKIAVGVVDFRGNTAKAMVADLNSKGGQQLYIPRGCGIGWVSLEKDSLMQIRYSRYVSRDNAMLIAWDDPQLSIPWPVSKPQLSTRSLNAQRLKSSS